MKVTLSVLWFCSLLNQRVFLQGSRCYNCSRYPLKLSLNSVTMLFKSNLILHSYSELIYCSRVAGAPGSFPTHHTENGEGRGGSQQWQKLTCLHSAWTCAHWSQWHSSHNDFLMVHDQGLGEWFNTPATTYSGNLNTRQLQRNIHRRRDSLMHSQILSGLHSCQPLDLFLNRWKVIFLCQSYLLN